MRDGRGGGRQRRRQRRPARGAKGRSSTPCLRAIVLRSRSCASFLASPIHSTHSRSTLDVHSSTHDVTPTTRVHSCVPSSPSLLLSRAPLSQTHSMSGPQGLNRATTLITQKRHNSTRPHTSVSATLPSTVYLIFGHLSHLRPLIFRHNSHNLDRIEICSPPPLFFYSEREASFRSKSIGSRRR